jgi:hypothetical protein
MAVQFAQRVQERVGQPVSYAELLAAMEEISSKSLTLDKVVKKVQARQKSTSRRPSRRQTAQPERASAIEPVESVGTGRARLPQTARAKKPATILKALQGLLQENWDRAESEGLRPDRMPVEAFVNAVYRYTDRREAIPRRILQAAQQLDQADVLLTPALVADAAHELFKV